jgi:mono/diheme cytochrome c family protein
VGLACAALLHAGDPDAAFFATRIRPLLAHNCFACHTDSRLGGLRLDSRASMLQGGKSGPAIQPNNPDESLLIQAVSHSHARLKMPPTGKLKDEEIADLRSWIKSGAVWPETPAPSPSPAYVITAEQRAFWAFQPVHKPALPDVKNEAWVKSPIDRFILAKLEQNGLRPAGPAKKQALIRRATFDLIGLPPTPEEVDAFVSDSSRDAFARVVDRLLASPHYGERWGRYWLDLARYADGALGASKDTPFANAYRYRDWVIQALNADMPYDVFVKAQLAADLLDSADREKLLPALGFLALGGGADERVDVTTKTFLGLTVGCAQCHNHKYDPIPTKDFYSLLGVFRSSQNDEIPLTTKDAVEAWKKHKKKVDDLQEAIDDFIKKQSAELSEMLAAKTARYMIAAWQGAPAEGDLNAEILGRWVRYLKNPDKEHPYLKLWFTVTAAKPALADVTKAAEDFQKLVVAMFAEKREIDDRNYVKLGGAKGAKDERTRQYTNLESLEIEKYYLWRDLASDPFMRNGVLFPGGIYYYGLPSSLKKDFDTRGGEAPPVRDIDDWLGREWKGHLDRMRAELAELKTTLPPQYPFLHGIRDSAKPANARVAIRGDQDNLGEEAPRRFLQILCSGEPKPFTKGSGRLELAAAIATADNPLTARVMVNRVWQLHFGKGIVRSPSNLGQLGERPTHPELLDYLAARFVAEGWSFKKLHREMMLSSVYMLGADHAAENYAKDPDNRLLWRFNLRQRLDVEALRDSLLAVAGTLDMSAGGPPKPIGAKNHRRTVYAYIGRTKPDAMLTLFDFPNPNNTSEQRTVTAGPLQRLFFMNSDFVRAQAQALAGRLQGSDPKKIGRAYRLLFARRPTEQEVADGLAFLKKGGEAWVQYTQVLLSSSEFSAVN